MSLKKQYFDDESPSDEPLSGGRTVSLEYIIFFSNENYGSLLDNDLVEKVIENIVNDQLEPIVTITREEE